MASATTTRALASVIPFPRTVRRRHRTQQSDAPSPARLKVGELVFDVEDNYDQCRIVIGYGLHLVGSSDGSSSYRYGYVYRTSAGRFHFGEHGRFVRPDGFSHLQSVREVCHG
ncbi:MAG TPA: hypothetical protein VFY73_25455 [Ideonella sp.]|uniref:hypothetical protein n=1 Tax=Ideonella sp. TaxID=1929293 RepID=UPI002E2EC748|nr:hypothetical protein [Ideonella sp.]HEX5687377.1 hypothetical protein [Ideonella sp.]